MKAKKRTPSKKQPPLRSEGDLRFLRRTVTLPPDLDAELSALVGTRGYSAFVQRDIAHELQRERIVVWFDQRDAGRQGAALTPEAEAFAEDAWHEQ